MKKNTKLMLSALAVVGTVASIGFADSALAYRGDSAVKGPNYTPERHEKMEKAFATNDYAAWKSLMVGSKGRVTEVVNASNFEKFAEAHRLAEQGKISEAKAKRAELGLGMGAGAGNGQRMGSGRGLGIHRATR